MRKARLFLLKLRLCSNNRLPLFHVDLRGPHGLDCFHPTGTASSAAYGILRALSWLETAVHSRLQPCSYPPTALLKHTFQRLWNLPAHILTSWLTTLTPAPPSPALQFGLTMSLGTPRTRHCLVCLPHSPSQDSAFLHSIRGWRT